ncbi:MAG TPA: protein kinase [Candidatus Udaeobacter sp.]|nr:protein kinase [Candidatus Udaeobacter sp.]
MTANGLCENCGARISSDAAREVCPACLLESGLGLLGDESEDAVDHEPLPRRSHGAPPVKTLGDFGDYELLEEIGRGGQGVVYRAHQKSLNRTVALKVIGLGPWTTEAHLKRFRREAEAAASLDHPFIVPIHEVGEHEGCCYFSMNFVEGGQLDETVRRVPMSIRQAAELIAKVARTVHYAHEHGILHRDIKPGNILLDAKSEPHLTDFGLARLVDAESTVTRTLEAMGTPSYMAPEQAAGNNAAVGKATDVYGLGAVFYELLTGHPPFAGGTTLEIVRMVLDTEPRQPRLLNPKVDRDLSTICLKCLEKDPKRRYSSALALAEDLEHWLKHEPIQAKRSGFFTHARKWVRRKPDIAALIAALAALATAIAWNVWRSELFRAAPEKSIAVLPFENLSRDPDNAYFAAGIQEEILTRLASISDLKVISRTSTQHYQSKPKNLGEIAKQLGVAHILEGSVQKSGDVVRVNVQLIEAASDSNLWANTFDRKLTDIFSVESEVAKAIADSLNAKLSGAEEQLIAARPTSDLTAHELYLKGRVLWGKRGGDNIRQAIAFYEQAIVRDRNYASAYAGLAEAYVILPIYTDASAREAYAKGKAAALTALQLDDKLAEAHNALALVLFLYLDFPGSIAEFQRAIALNPNYATAHHWYGFNPLSTLGRFDESIAEGKRAVELDPLSPVINSDLGSILMVARRFDQAIAQLRKTLEMDPTFSLAHGALGEALQFKGDLPGAIAEYTKAQELGGDTRSRVLMAAAKAQSGDKDAVVRMLAELEEASRNREISGAQRAVLYLSLGNRAEAIRCLEQSVADHDSQDVAWIKVYPRWDPLRGDPRFEALVQKVVGPGK